MLQDPKQKILQITKITRANFDDQAQENPQLNEQYEYLKRFYSKNESTLKIQKLIDYYQFQSQRFYATEVIMIRNRYKMEKSACQQHSFFVENFPFKRESQLVLKQLSGDDSFASLLNFLTIKQGSQPKKEQDNFQKKLNYLPFRKKNKLHKRQEQSRGRY